MKVKRYPASGRWPNAISEIGKIALETFRCRRGASVAIAASFLWAGTLSGCTPPSLGGSNKPNHATDQKLARDITEDGIHQQEKNRVWADLEARHVLDSRGWSFLTTDLYDRRMTRVLPAGLLLSYAVDLRAVPARVGLSLLEERAVNVVSTERASRTGFLKLAILDSYRMAERLKRPMHPDFLSESLTGPNPGLVSHLDPLTKTKIDATLRNSDPSVRRQAAYVLIQTFDMAKADKTFALARLATQMAKSTGADKRFWHVAKEIVLGRMDD